MDRVAEVSSQVIQRRTLPTGGVSWRVRWREPDGSERSKSFKTQRAAKAFDAERATTVDSWVSPHHGTVRLAAVWPRYIEAQTHAKPSTIAGYNFTWRKYIEPEFGNWPIGKIQFADVSRWVVDLGSSKGPATTRKAYRVLSLVLDWSVKARQIPRNEAVGVKLPRQPQKLARATDAASVELLSSLVSPPARDLVLVLAYTGIRWGEAAALQVGDIDLGRRRVTVSRNFVEVGGELRLGSPKSHKSRQVPITERLVEIFARRVDGMEEHDLVFGRANGSPWRNSNFRRDSNWSKATANAGLAGFRIHDLRHTAASLMIESGASVVDVAAVLGHASSHTTLTIYAHLIGARLDDVADKLGRTIVNSCGQNAATTGLAQIPSPTIRKENSR